MPDYKKNLENFLNNLKEEETGNHPHFSEISQFDSSLPEDLPLEQKQLYLSDYWLGMINKF